MSILMQIYFFIESIDVCLILFLIKACNAVYQFFIRPGKNKWQLCQFKVKSSVILILILCIAEDRLPLSCRKFKHKR